MTGNMGYANAWVFDIETFSNAFTLVARQLDSKSYKRFALHFSRDDSEELKAWLRTKPTLIGYNSLGFDGQVIQWMWDKDVYDPERIYEFVQNLMELMKEGGKRALPYAEWDLTFNHIDLLSINHYDWGARTTSLKWLEFTLRWKKMADLPMDHADNVSKSGLNKLLTYNRNDVDVTYEFYYKCLPSIELRQDLVNEYGERRIINMSDSSLGSYILKHEYCQKTGKNIRQLKKGTDRKSIDVSECIFPYVSFESEEFNTILDQYNNTTLTKEKGKKNIVLKGKVEASTEFDGMHFDFGVGGLHGFRESGTYRSSEDKMILSIDFKSYYPHLMFVNKQYPEHLGEVFCEVYEGMYKKRGTFAKGTAKNYALKIALNGAYGKTNTTWDQFLKDPKITVVTTVNGQLTMAMLAEKLHKYGELIMVNTDGLEIRIDRKDEQKVKDACSEFEKLVGIPLEYGEYSLIACRDVNNYLAIDVEGDVKRKGVFETYADIEGDGGPHQFHKKISNAIVREALTNYYVDNIPVEETILNGNNIHDYLTAQKKKRNFEHWVFTADEQGVTSFDRFNERTIRYFMSTKGGNLYKFYNDGRKNNLQNIPGTLGQLVKMNMNIKKENIMSKDKFGNPKSNYPDLNYDYYIYETKSLIETLPES